MGIVEPGSHTRPVHPLAAIGSSSLVHKNELHASRCKLTSHGAREWYPNPPVFFLELRMEMQGLLAVCMNSFIRSFL